MAEARLAAGVLVSALIRRIEGAGGQAMVLGRGDATAGALLAVIADRGASVAVMERALGPHGYAWARTGPADPAERDAYVARRRRGDTDLWIVELDHPDAATILAEVAG